MYSLMIIFIDEQIETTISSEDSNESLETNSTVSPAWSGSVLSVKGKYND